MEGWVSIHRKITDHPDYFSEKFTRMGAWIDLLLLANHKTGYVRIRGILVEVRRGQTGASQKTLCKRWKWSAGKVDRFLLELEKSGQIVLQKTNVTTLITISNYDQYQTDRSAKNTADNTTNDVPNEYANGTPNGKQIDTRVDANGNQTETNNNVYKDINVNNHTHSENLLEYQKNARAYAREILSWIGREVPTVQTMPEPFTEDQVSSLLRKYDPEDIKRLVLQMHNKEAFKNRNAYSTFVAFAGNDSELREKKKNGGRLYSFAELEDLVTSGKCRGDDFVPVYLNGHEKPMWRKITDVIRTN